MSSGKDDSKGIKKDIGMIKEVIDEVLEDVTDVKLRMERLEKGQERIISTLDFIAGRLETHRQEDAATTMLLDDHEHRIVKLEAVAA